jgi:2-dehydro-3-deoxy-D-arabinonate dehydratase
MLVRFFHPEQGPSLGLRLDDTVYRLREEHVSSLGAWLRSSSGRVQEAINELEALARRSSQIFPAALFDNVPATDQPHWLAPVEEQEVWAAGVTYERSRQARQEEAIDGGDIYARVYVAERPELFFKAQGPRVVGPLGMVGIRRDASWSVPEPELAILVNPALEVVGFAVGNDMSSRDIEGGNPLYLPQAKIYTASCALGPGVVLNPTTEWPAAAIRLSIHRAGASAFEGEVHTSRIQRHISTLLDYLGRSYQFPEGAVLLTGTGIIPPEKFTLAAGDSIAITIDGIGTLTNTVMVV